MTWQVPFMLDCRECGGEVEEINRSPVIAGSEVRVIVRCTKCPREYVVEVMVHPVNGTKPPRPGGDSVAR